MTKCIDAFFKKHIIIHTHIEKCGGSTLLHYLKELFDEKYILDLRPYPALCSKELLKQHPEIKKKLSKCRILSGHTGYQEHWEDYTHISGKLNLYQFIPKIKLSSHPKNPLYIASIRHPVERLLSLFQYIRIRPDHPDFPLFAESFNNNDFDAYVADLIEKKSMKIQSGMSAFIKEKGKATSSLLEAAKKSFDNNYFAIIPYNKTHELAQIFSDAFGLCPVKQKIINLNNAKQKITPSEKTSQILEEQFSDDIQLYDYILKNYEEKLDEAKKQLQKKIDKLIL